MVHPRQHFLCSHQLFLRELSSVTVNRDLIVVLDECRAGLRHRVLVGDAGVDDVIDAR